LVELSLAEGRLAVADDDTFRAILVVLFAVFIPVGLYFRLRAHTGEKIDRRQEGMVILVGLRLSALVLFTCGMIWVIHPAWMAWSRLPVSVVVRWAGVAFAFCGIALWIWTFSHLGKNVTDTVVTRERHSLVTSGPYQWVRHPFYVAILLVFTGLSLAMANWLMLVMSGVVFFGFIVPRTRIEERKLVERFGDDYRTYMRRVGRFVPRLGRGSGNG
jgi:protein-S-isoprenylcysteine O-methyltransferase Ste14